MTFALIVRHFSERKGGAERYAVCLARLLREDGHAVHVIAQTSDDAVAFPKISIHPVAVGGPRFLGPILFQRAVRRALSGQAFDIVFAVSPVYPTHIYSMCDGVFLHWFTLQAPARSVRLARYLLRPVWAVNLFLERRLLFGGCRRLIANSHLCRDQAMQYYGVHPDQIEVIYNGVDTSIFHPGVRAARTAVRGKYGIEADAPLLLFVAMNFKRKGLGEVIEGVARLRPAFPQLRVLVVGKGNPKPYQARAQALGMSDALIFTGAMEETAPFYGAADLFVLPTHYDPFAGVCLEAMACGLPVITTQQNGAAELIEEGENGYTVASARDVDRLAEKIGRALSSDRAAMGRRAAETALRHAQEAHGQHILCLCRRVASETLPLDTLPGAPPITVHRADRDALAQSGLLSYDAIMSCAWGARLKTIRARTITRLTLLPKTVDVYLKRHRAPSAWASLLGRPWVSEGRREWDRIIHFHNVGLPTMTPVAVGERRSLFADESFLMTQALEGYTPLEQWVPETLATLPDGEIHQTKTALVQLLARLTRKMHQIGFYHRDFYLTHILLKVQPDGFDLKIIDLQRVLFHPWFPRRWQVKDLAALHYSTPSCVTLRDRMRFYKIYRGGRRLNRVDRRLLRRIHQRALHMHRHTVKMKRRRECGSGSS